MKRKSLSAVRIRFSLRCLACLLTVACVTSAYLAYLIHQIRSQQDVVIEIRSFGGEATYAGQEHGRHVSILGKLLSPFTGTSSLQDVVLVGFFESQIEDDGLKNLHRLSQLRSLYLRSTDISDKGVVHVIKISSLQRLDISATHITDQSLLRLVGLPELRDLYVSKGAITDRSIAALKKMKKLEYLYVYEEMDPGVASKLRKALPNCNVFVAVAKKP